ncbi:MAG: ATP-binding cassette domain-containing protein [Oscillospiraceae bacterium]|nr:ATP-binding cassette domain-containing protein [Oscillospiraceae bacterium]
MRREVLRMERVCCLEQGVMQLHDFNLSIMAGEIVGLLPVNSSGLTTLLKLLQSNTPLRDGYVYYMEKQINTWRDSKKYGNRHGRIQSESCLVNGLTVADNIFVLRPGFKTWLMRPRIFKEQLALFLEGIGISIASDAYIEELTGFERIVVDVIKSVMSGRRLIVLRDIGADINESELKKIHLLLRHYIKEGISFLYIDYHFEALRKICDKVALMSNGRIIKLLEGEFLTQESLNAYAGSYVVGTRQEKHQYETTKKKHSSSFFVDNMSSHLVKELSFSISSGECVVIQNADLQVYGEVLSIMSGKAVPESGQLLLDGKPVSFEMGGDTAVIHEQPSKTMLFGELSYLDNLCFLLDKRLPEIWLDSRLREGIRREYEEILGADVFDGRINALSEAQKYDLVYSRIALQKPKVVFCAQPFRGADMELRMRILELMLTLLDKGIALVILTVNLVDSLSLANSLIRVYRDKPQEVYSRNEFSTMPILRYSAH